jgi:peptidoglycan hydrolase-like protein with peptidoglycan-binding domain
MYMSNYYQGTHNPSTAEGRQANINSYASAMRSWTPSIRNALTSWYPGAQAPSNFPDPDTSSDVWVQWTINRLGLIPPLVEDGMLGPLSRAAIKAFQKNHGLHPDGVPGPMTRTALAIALRK